MTANLKSYLYRRGTDKALDSAFDSGSFYGALKLGGSVLFWKIAFRWYAIDLSHVQRVFRRVEPVFGKLCAGGSNYDIESLVLILEDGAELELLIGKNEIGNAVRKDAQRLMQTLQEQFPQLQFGKP